MRDVSPGLIRLPKKMPPAQRKKRVESVMVEEELTAIGLSLTQKGLDSKLKTSAINTLFDERQDVVNSNRNQSLEDD